MKDVKSSLGILVAAFAVIGCTAAVSPNMTARAMTSGGGGGNPAKVAFTATSYTSTNPNLERAAFAGGCFWGLEYRFRHVPGVIGTAVGFSGGNVDNPSYERVCEHNTGHAETVELQFDPKVVSYRKLVDLFMTDFHNPTTMNRQGPDEGDQYRSAIWYLDDNQKKDALAGIADAQKNLEDKIVTEVKPLGKFWMAEEYHQNYSERTGRLICPIEEPKKIIH